MKELRFFWLIRIHGLVDPNVPRMVDFFFLPVLSVTGKAPLFQVSTMSETYCSNELLPHAHLKFGQI